MASEFRPPAARLGDMVLWFPGGDPSQAPHVGLVTAVGLDALDINTFAPSMVACTPREGARHISDPRARSVELQEAGGWMHRDEWYSQQAELARKRAEAAAAAQKKREAEEKLIATPAGVT